MTGAYVPPEEAVVRLGIVLSVILKVVWLGVLGEPISALSWIALIAGGICFWLGFSRIRSTRPGGKQGQA